MPFGDLLEVLDPQYCPDLPLNGESAGEESLCRRLSFTYTPEAKKILRDHLTTVSMDQYSIVATDEKVEVSVKVRVKRKKKVLLKHGG